jgi:hypothetical protein
MGTRTRNFANNVASTGRPINIDVTEFDDDKIVNDLSTLALREATQSNRVAVGTSSQYVDVFQDSSGIASNTNAPRNASEYVSTVAGGALNGSYTDFSSSNFSSPANWSWGGNNLTIGTSPDNDDGASSGTGSTPISFGTGRPFRWRGGPHYNTTGNNPWFGLTRTSSDTRALGLDASGELYWYIGTDTSTNGFYAYDSGSMGRKVTQDFGNSGYYFGVERDNLGIIKAYHKTGSAVDFTETPIYTFSTNYLTNTYYLILSGTGGHRGDLDNLQHDIGSVSSVNATGNFISNAVTTSSTSSMGAMITYQDNAGTNALNTDIILQLSADNGSNFSTATLTAMPDFASGIKMAKVNDLAVTPGTQLKYKILFANQASGSKEARIRGVSLNY